MRFFHFIYDFVRRITNDELQHMRNGWILREENWHEHWTMNMCVELCTNFNKNSNRHASILWYDCFEWMRHELDTRVARKPHFNYKKCDFMNEWSDILQFVQCFIFRQLVHQKRIIPKPLQTAMNGVENIIWMAKMKYRCAVDNKMEILFSCSKYGKQWQVDRTLSQCHKL